MLLSSLFAIVIGYFVGSIPAAFVIVKLASRRDVRREGSGNVGALNSYEVTKKKWIGITVLLLDIAKGMAAVVIASQLEGSNYSVQALAGLSAIFGHNFNIWLRFHGGRGLATSLGVMLLLGWIFALVWCLLWIAAYGIWRNVHAGNVAATVIAPLSLPALPHLWIEKTSWTAVTSGEINVVCGVLAVLILVRHAGYIRSVLIADHLNNK